MLSNIVYHIISKNIPVGFFCLPHHHHHHPGQHSLKFKTRRKCQKAFAYHLHLPDETQLMVLLSICRSTAGKTETECAISSTHAIDYSKNVNNVVSDIITQNSIWAVTPLKGNTSVNSVMRKNETRALPDNSGWKCSNQLWTAL